MEFDQPLLWFLLLGYLAYLPLWWWIRKNKEEPTMGFSDLSATGHLSSGIKPVLVKFLPYLRLLALLFLILAIALRFLLSQSHLVKEFSRA